MKKQFLPLVAVAAAMLLASCKGGSGDAVDLKLNLQPGSQYLYTTETKMQNDLGPMKSNNDMTMEYTYDVAAGDNGNKRITVTYDRIAMDMKSASMNMSYDSKDAAKGDTLLKSLSNMLHKPFAIVVTDRGEITRVEGLAGILNAMGDTTTLQGAMMRQQMSGTFNDTAVKSMMQQALNIFPDHPVRPGDTWKKSYNLSMSMMTLKMDNEYKLNSVSNGTAHIDVASKITGGGAMGGEQMKNMQLNLNGDQKGTMDVEVASGLVTDSKLKQNIKGEMSMSGMKMPLTMVQDIRITAKKK